MSNLEDRSDSVAGRLKLARTLMMKSQQDFGEQLGVHKNTISKWERGDAVPDLNSATLLCSKLGLSPYWLLNGEGPMLDKDRDVQLVAGSGTRAGDLRGYKLSEVSGGPKFDATMANLQGNLAREAESLSTPNIDRAVLFDVVRILEETLEEAGGKLPPDAKAEVICQLYELVLESEAEFETTKPVRMLRLIKGALAKAS